MKDLQRMNDLFERAQRRAPLLVALIPVAVIWEVVGRMDVTMAVPPLTDIWSALFVVTGEEAFAASLRASLYEFSVGLGLAVAIGIPIGLLMGLFPMVEEALDFYINIFMGAPMAAFVPLLIAVFGVGPAAIVSTIVLFSVFVIIVNTYAGVLSAKRNLLEMGRSFGASQSTLIRKIVMPSAMPMLLTGLRLGFARAVSGLILGEMLIVIVGLGGMIMQRGSAFQIEQLWALVFIALTFSIAGTRGLEYVQRRTTGWAATGT